MTSTPFDPEGLKATLKNLKDSDNSILSKETVEKETKAKKKSATSPSVGGTVKGTVAEVSDTLVKYSDVIPAPPKRIVPELPKKGMNIKFANLLLPWVEQYWSGKKRYPDTSAMMEHFGLTRDEVLLINTNRMWLACLDRRGIRRPDVAEDFLSPKQMAAIALITNYHDTRHKDVKLASIGVDLEEYNGWMNDSAFKNALSARSDDVLNHVGVDANIALAQLIQAKDFRATKFYFEITGKASSPEAINVKQSMQILIEAVQKHVRDPEILQAIANEVNQVRAIQGV